MNKKKKGVSKVGQVTVHVKASPNNTILSISDMSGNVYKQFSSGMRFKGPKRSSQHASNSTGREAGQWSVEHGGTDAHIVVSGGGSGRDSCPKAYAHSVEGKMSILSVTFKDSPPHGGCRPRKKPRK